MKTEAEKPQLTVEYPTAEECRLLSARLSSMGDAIKGSQGFMGTAAYRAALDLDYLSRLIDANPVKQIGQWTVLIKEAKLRKKKARVKRTSSRR